MKKIVLALLLSLGLFVPRQAYAGTNQIVTCEENTKCTSNTSSPLFEESAFVPGQTVSQTLEVVNNDDESCNLHMKIEDKTDGQEVDIRDRVFMEISVGSTTYFGDPQQTLQQLFDKKDVGVGTVSAGDSRVVSWQAIFDHTVGNEFQGVGATFDFDLTVTCGSSGGGGGDSSPTPSPTSSPTTFFGQVQGIIDEATGSGDVGGGSGEGEVMGTSACEPVQEYLLWILLAVQLLLLLLNETAFRNDEGKKKHVFNLIITLLVIAFFYWFRDPECQKTDLFWLISLLLTAAVRMFGYAFLEDK